MKKHHYLLLAFVILTYSIALAQTPKKFERNLHQKGITKKLAELQNAPARLAAKEKPGAPFLAPLKFRLDVAKGFKYRFQTQAVTRGYDFEKEEPEDEESGAERTMAVAGNTTTLQTWSNFLATTYDEYPIGWPPDPNGDVGASQVVSLTNGSLKVFEKRAVTEPPLVSYKGVLRKPASASYAIPLRNFFSPLLFDTTAVSDPHIRYDRLTKRWFVVAIEINETFENNNVLLAVSDGERITDSSSFTYYAFPSAIIPYSPDEKSPPFLDYPTLGVDKNAVLIGGNDFFFDSVYFVGYAIDKKLLLQGVLAGYALKLGVYDSYADNYYGLVTPQGVQNGDPAASKSFFAGISLFNDGINVAALTYDKYGYLTDVTETAVKTDPYQFPRDITALGSPMPIDPLDTRLLAASIHKNKLTGKSSLWTTHAIGVNQSGNFVEDSVFVQQARTGARWYEINNLYTKPHLAQVGTLYDAVPASGRRATMYFNPTVASSGQGRTVLSGTTSAYKSYLNAFIAGRNYGDAAGTLGTPQRVTATRGIYAAAFSFGTTFFYISRWGDFSQTVVDPEDDQTIWTFQEYCNADDSYGLRATQVKAPPPATPLPLNMLSNRGDTTVTLKGVSVDNSGFFDPGSDKGGPGFNRLSVKGTGNLIASYLKFISPTEIRFRLNTKNKPAGKYTLVITNPDGQIVTTEFQIVTEALKGAAGANNLRQEEVQKWTAFSTVTPNPTTGNFKLQLSAAKDWNARIILMDVSGKQLSESHYNLSKGTNNLSLSLAAYDKGTYLAAVYNPANVLIAVQKIIKQ